MIGGRNDNTLVGLPPLFSLFLEYTNFLNMLLKTKKPSSLFNNRKLSSFHYTCVVNCLLPLMPEWAMSKIKLETLALLTLCMLGNFFKYLFLSKFGGVLAYGTLALAAPQVRDFLLILLLGSS